MSVIEAATAGFKDMADGTVRFFFDVEPRHAGAALELFRARGTPAALAALQVGYAQAADTSPEPVAAKEPLGPLAYWLVLRCNEPEFWRWLQSIGYNCASAHAAGVFSKSLLAIESRKDIDGDSEAEERFHRLIRGPYAKWCAARGVTA